MSGPVNKIRFKLDHSKSSETLSMRDGPIDFAAICPSREAAESQENSYLELLWLHEACSISARHCPCFCACSKVDTLSRKCFRELPRRLTRGKYAADPYAYGGNRRLVIKTWLGPLNPAGVVGPAVGRTHIPRMLLKAGL